MKTSKRILIAIIALLSFHISQAQVSKIESAIEDENYERVVKLAERYMEDQEYKKDPLVYYYHAQGLFELSKDEYWYSKNPDAIKTAVKSVYKGKKRDEDSTAINKFSDFIDELAAKQNELAEEKYNINKFSKAFKMYELSYGLNHNRHAYVMTAKNALLMMDSAIAQHRYKEIIGWYLQDLEEGNEDAEQVTDPHLYFVDKYWQAGNFDSANFYLDQARSIFGNGNRRIDFFQKKVALDMIGQMPPSELMMEYIQKNLRYFPDDKDFLHKENALYVYLLRNHIEQERLADAELLLARFCSEKVERSSHEMATTMMITDEFISKETSHVLWKLSVYFQKYHHREAAAYVLEDYIYHTAADSTDEAVAARWLVISDYALSSKGIPFGAFVLNESLAKTDQHPDLLALRAKLVNTSELEPMDRNELEAIYGLAKDEYAFKKKSDQLERLELISDFYLNKLSQETDFTTAGQVMLELASINPKKDRSERLMALARDDFYNNYFMTRTRAKNEAGEIVDIFEWNGNINQCDPGSLEPEMQQKVLDRINYFRRAAGVPEVVFDEHTNALCQEAALIMSVNRKVSHTPAKNWRCYTANGAYAAEHSLLTQNSNTSTAVTYLMDDQSSPAVGNRRWLLNPGGKVFGHGSTSTNAVIWALDDTGNVDTAKFQEQAICWPPQGYVPQMLLFKYWSFSMFRDLNGAKVAVNQDGKALEVKIEKLVDGYGTPTLVFTPAVLLDALQPTTDFEVTVTLSDDSQYSYTVHAFDYNPGRDQP